MKLIKKNLYTYVKFEEGDVYLKDTFLKHVHKTISARQDGFQYSPQYKNGVWDGYVDFYDYEKDRFPTGLVSKIENLLGELQTRFNFQYEVVDERDECFLAPEDIDKSITLFDNNVGSITLRDYQYEAVYQSLVNYNGIVHIATNGGKCISSDSMILTPQGYKSLEEIFNSQGVTVDGEEATINLKYPLINRYGDIECTSHFTKNGIKETKRIKTDRGVELTNTLNHPLLVLKDNEFRWVETKDLQVGDILVSRKGDSRFGTDSTVTDTEEAYVLGCMIADSYMGKDYRLSFSNDQEELLNIVSDYWNTISDKPTYLDKHKKSKGVTIHLHDKKVASEFYKKFGIDLGIAKDKKVPECILNSNRDIQIAFLSGYLECECSIASDYRDLEVTSASKNLLRDIQIMLFNLGIDNKLSEKVVKNYPDNYYGRLTVRTRELKKLLSLMSFKTQQRQEQKRQVMGMTFKSQYGVKLFGLREDIKAYRDSVKGNCKDFKKYVSRDSISVDRLREMLELYPDGNSTIKDKFKSLTQNEVFYQEIVEIKDNGFIPTFDVCLPETHSFIVSSVINHNTEIASGIIDQLRPQLEAGERIAFFTGSTEIFNQSADRIAERLNIKVGKVGAGKFDVQQVTVVMIPTLNANLKDPSEGVKVTPKQNIYKKIAQTILPRFEGGTNQRKLLQMMLTHYPVKTKVDATVKAELQNVLDTCGTDKEVLMKLRTYNAKFQEILEKKNGKKYEKYHKMRDFLDSVTVMIVDEAHHSKSDTWYNNLMTCDNALYRVALTGSIDKKDEMLWMRLQALFGEVVVRTTNNFLINEGHSARPTINMIPIANPDDILKLKDYREVYDAGISNNEFRNKLIAKLTHKWYNQDKGILIIVNFIEHGENISKLLDEMHVEHYFLHGEIDSETRKAKLNDMRSGKLKVMIATSLIDEGVDISGINALILGAGGKSLRQTLQRIGRALRKKKDDNTCQVFDFTDMTHKFLYTHSKQRMKIYEEEEFEIKHIGR